MCMNGSILGPSTNSSALNENLLSVQTTTWILSNFLCWVCITLLHWDFLQQLTCKWFLWRVERNPTSFKEHTSERWCLWRKSRRKAQACCWIRGMLWWSLWWWCYSSSSVSHSCLISRQNSPDLLNMFISREDGVITDSVPQFDYPVMTSTQRPVLFLSQAVHARNDMFHSEAKQVSFLKVVPYRMIWYMILWVNINQHNGN